MFLFIAYKPSSADYCRGCLMESYYDDFFTVNHLDEQKLIDVWSSYLLRNRCLRIHEEGYDFWIYKDGIQVFKEHYCSWDGEEKCINQYGYETPAYWEHAEEQEAAEHRDMEEINGIYLKAQAKAEATHIAQEESALKKQIAERQEIESLAKESRRKQFEQLQQEFGV